MSYGTTVPLVRSYAIAAPVVYKSATYVRPAVYKSYGLGVPLLARSPSSYLLGPGYGGYGYGYSYGLPPVYGGVGSYRSYGLGYKSYGGSSLGYGLGNWPYKSYW